MKYWHITTWMNLEDIMISERSQSPKATYWWFHLYEMSRIDKSMEISGGQGLGGVSGGGEWGVTAEWIQGFLRWWKCSKIALTGVVQWVECHPENQKIASSIPSQNTCLGCRPGPQLEACERQPIDVSHTHHCFFHSFSLPSPLSKNKYVKSFLKKENVLKLTLLMVMCICE